MEHNRTRNFSGSSINERIELHRINRTQSNSILWIDDRTESMALQLGDWMQLTRELSPNSGTGTTEPSYQTQSVVITDKEERTVCTLLASIPRSMEPWMEEADPKRIGKKQILHLKTAFVISSYFSVPIY